jgi:uncharacterized membrane protein
MGCAPVSADSACHPGRARRVCLGLYILWGLNVVDLALTLALMTTTGMLETNPLARALVHAGGSAFLLAAWKFLCITLATVILAALRRRWTAEAGTWFCVAALAITTISWIQYLHCDEVQLLTASSISETPAEWVVIRR